MAQQTICAAPGASMTLKKPVEIEILLQWTFIDELSKRHTSSAEGIWDRLSQYGSLGGINPDPGHGSAQRYPHFGLPHKDAEMIEKAVSALGSVAIDWNDNFDAIAGDLGALVTINDVDRSREFYPDSSSGWGQSQLDRTPLCEASRLSDGRLVKTVRARQAPRDVLMVNSINVAAMVVMHAVRRTRPDWRTDDMRPVPTVARGRPAIVGESRAKNLYTTGSYCPLIWEPSPIEVVQTRADYVAWRQGLLTLAETLELTEHVALPPAAAAIPWLEEEKARPKPRVFTNQPSAPQKILPLNPPRRRAGPPLRRPKHPVVQQN